MVMRAASVRSKKSCSSPAPSDGAEVGEHDAGIECGAPDLLWAGVDEEARRPHAGGRRRPGRWPSSSGSVARTRTPLPASSSSRMPSATIRPLPMISRRSATASTSRSRWLESRTVPPRSAKSRSTPRIQRMPSGSRPLAGSSRISTSGSPSRACAEPEPLAHAERVLAHALAGRGWSSPTSVEQLVDARRRHARSSARRRRAPRGRGGRGAGRAASSRTPTRGPGCWRARVRAVEHRAACPRRASRARRASASSWSCRRRWARGTRSPCRARSGTRRR